MILYDHGVRLETMFWGYSYPYLTCHISWNWKVSRSWIIKGDTVAILNSQWNRSKCLLTGQGNLENHVYRQWHQSVMWPDHERKSKTADHDFFQRKTDMNTYMNTVTDKQHTDHYLQRKTIPKMKTYCDSSISSSSSWSQMGVWMNLAPDILPDSLFQSVPLPLSSPPRDSRHFFFLPLSTLSNLKYDHVNVNC